MMTAIRTAQHYFNLSNNSNFDEIKLLFSKQTTYCSGTGEMFLGADDIMIMQRFYHGSFKSLNWQVNNVSEIKPGIVVLDFNFIGKTLAGEKVEYSGLETIIVHDAKIQHIDVHRK